MRYALQHEVALVLPGDGRDEAREVRAPDLEAVCGREPDHSEAERISRAARERLLCCAVCGTRLAKKFGRVNAWHFAQRPGESRCDHEAETVEHREAKLALLEALRRMLPGGPRGWRVEAERPLADGRHRPDILAEHGARGVRVSFEVQCADLSKEEWRERHEDYAALSVRDVWLLGHHREGRRDVLASVLAREYGQRLAYLGRRSGEEGHWIREAMFAPASRDPHRDPSFGSHDDPVRRAYVRPGGSSGGAPVAAAVEYGPEDIRLGDDGVLSTPADDAFEEAERERKEAARSLEVRRAEQEWRWQTGRELRARERGEKLRRQERVEAWLFSEVRAKALSELGPHVVSALLEREGDLDRAILAHPGEWKTGLFLSRVHAGRGEIGGLFAPSFDLREAVEEVFKDAPALPGLEDRAVGAVRAFVARLCKEGFLQLVDARKESFLVVDTAAAWTRRLKERIRGWT